MTSAAASRLRRRQSRAKRVARRVPPFLAVRNPFTRWRRQRNERPRLSAPPRLLRCDSASKRPPAATVPWWRVPGSLAP